MAERAVPVFDEAETTMDMSHEGMDMDDKAKVIKAQLASADMIAKWRPWLFPEDGDG